jgi:hypothetical protein
MAVVLRFSQYRPFGCSKEGTEGGLAYFTASFSMTSIPSHLIPSFEEEPPLRRLLSLGHRHKADSDSSHQSLVVNVEHRLTNNDGELDILPGSLTTYLVRR